jgi:hypothetical protein
MKQGFFIVTHDQLEISDCISNDVIPISDAAAMFLYSAITRASQ